MSDMNVKDMAALIIGFGFAIGISFLVVSYPHDSLGVGIGGVIIGSCLIIRRWCLRFNNK